MSLELISKDKRFYPLFWTMYLGALNDNLFKNALVLLITYKSISLMGMNSGALVAMCGGIFILPFFLFSATAGQLADSKSKTTLIRITKITELIVMTLAAIGFYSNSFTLLLIVLFLMGTQSTFFGPLKYGIIPQLLKKDELVLGNAYIGGGTFLAILVGTILGGVVVSTDDPGLLSSLGVLSVSILGIISAFKVKNVEAVDSTVRPDYTFVRPTIEIIKLTMKERSIFHTCMGISWFWFIGAAILSLIPSLCKDVFNGNEAVGTLFLATFTIGMGIGSFLAERLSQKRPETGMVAIAAVLMSIFLADLAYSASQYSFIQSENHFSVLEFLRQDYSLRAIIDLLLVSVFGGTYIIPQFTYLQDFTPRAILSRVIAGNNIWNAIFMVSAAVMIMVLSSLSMSIAQIILIIAVLNFLFSFYLYYVNSDVTLRFLFWIMSKVIYKLEIEGRDNIPTDGAVVIACNHVSFIDWVLIMSASPRPVRFVIDYAYYYAKGMKFWFKQAHLIPIATRKQDPQILNEAFELIKQSLEEKAVVGIFPEGWITRDGKLRKFQPGIKKIVETTPTIVVPMVIKGLWGSFFSFEGKGVLKGFSLRRRRVTLKILPPIAADKFNFKELEEIIHSEAQ
ncbi:MFS transporter [Halobacteriovorax sp. HLS]|uniref:MFS transporter n=1 Tax=Halobacteriovorax sp. HLS TaxID=2234000 RepID=UPI000FDC506B|nr:MFS transporter [Halobacteriovorax sp. HLS]